jgi:predicted Ser/Thr protein kinase
MKISCVFKCRFFLCERFLVLFKYQKLEAKRQQNIEDNRRFLAALKITDVSPEIYLQKLFFLPISDVYKSESHK